MNRDYILAGKLSRVAKPYIKDNYATDKRYIKGKTRRRVFAVLML